ncbi:MAG: carotenoid biosynthesis protein [Actinomycetota bacterium]|nr:carotenoid biosynthesis protein [Actinomycetota bacterium]
MRANVIVFEASVLVLSPFFYMGAKRYLGRSRNRIFLSGAVLFSLAIETGMVLGGMKNYYWYSINSYYKHYPLGGYIIWLGLVPLAATLLFYMVCATSYIAGGILAPKKGALAQSAVAAVVTLVFYLLIEPVAVTNHWWTWNAKSFYFLDIPVFALLGAMLATLLYTFIYQKTIMELEDVKVLGAIEAKTIKRWALDPKKATRNLSLKQLMGLFAFRCFAALVAYGFVIAPIIFVLWILANRGQIKSSW